MKKILPVGSIVVLKSNKECMIIGYPTNIEKEKEEYDYVCTNPKEGLTKEQSKLKENEDYYNIKEEEIKRVRFIGFSDLEFNLYEVYLDEINKRIKEEKEKDIEITREKLMEIIKEVMTSIMKKKGESNER